MKGGCSEGAVSGRSAGEGNVEDCTGIAVRLLARQIMRFWSAPALSAASLSGRLPEGKLQCEHVSWRRAPGVGCSHWFSLRLRLR